jgi:hypothetical protein
MLTFAICAERLIVSNNTVSKSGNESLIAFPP